MRWLVGLGFLSSLGCGGLDPEVGALREARCVDEDSDPTQDVSFARDILPIIEAEVGCRCHLPEASDPIGFIATGLNLSTREALLSGGIRSGADIVTVGSACDSILYQKTGSSPPFGSRMPFDGPPLLGEEARQRIADWIIEGARP